LKNSSFNFKGTMENTKAYLMS